MELTPQLLETQQFPEKWRGYDQDAVDEFLERVGVGLAELQDRLRTTVARLKELDEGVLPSPASSASASLATESEIVASVGAPATGSDVTVVARALVLAQQAADTALAEAHAEGERITEEARREADRLLREAEVRHEAATSRLADADAHVAELADEALSSARSEAAKLISEAETTAAALTRDARIEAERLSSTATATAERQADEVATQRTGELDQLDIEIVARRAESKSLRAEIHERQAELRTVVDGLQTLVGRVGSLGSAANDVTPPAMEAAIEPEVVEETISKIESEPGPAPVEDDVVIDLTAKESPVDDTGEDEVNHVRPTPAAADSTSKLPKWASVQETSAAASPRRGLTVVATPEEDLEPVVERQAVTAEVGGVVDDPFLAALRGPDRMEFDGSGDPDVDDSSFKRRRRRRL